MDKPGFDESTAVAITGKIMIIAIVFLFLVVVFVLFLHLYAKWCWWRIEEPTAPPPSGRNRNRHRLVFAPGPQDTGRHPLPSATKGLDSTILNSLPVLMFHQDEFKEGLECAVCLCELLQGEKARLLPRCNHGFHLDCIDMWFQSHSTCPLCRNPVVAVESENSGTVMSEDEVNAYVHDDLAPGYSADSPSFPTNVLFWGNQTRVSSGGGGACLEEGASASSSSDPFASSSLTSGGGRPEGMLVIDIPINVNENFQEEESKSPLPTRLRSLKRLLSREKRVAPSSSGSSSIDV